MLWPGVVLDSVVIRALEMQNRVHPNHDPSRFGHLTHHVVLLKEYVVEVVAQRPSRSNASRAQPWTPQLPPWVANRRPHIGRVGCQPAVQAARRSPRSVAVDEIQQEVGLPHVTAALGHGHGRTW